MVSHLECEGKIGVNRNPCISVVQPNTTTIPS